MTREIEPTTFTAAEVNREVTNDSLVTVESADSTGSDETKETGDAKKGEHENAGRLIREKCGTIVRNWQCRCLDRRIPHGVHSGAAPINSSSTSDGVIPLSLSRGVSR